MKYDFNRVIDRTGTYSMKYDDDGFFHRMVPDFRLDKDTIRLFLADMDFQCAPAITKAMHRVADFSTFGYTTADSEPEYRGSIIRWYKKRHGVDIKPEWIIPSDGALGGVGRTIEAFSNPGDGVIICGPVYSNFTSTIKQFGRKVVNCQMLQPVFGDYQMDWENFEKLCEAEENKVHIICSPVNPIGKVWTAEELIRIADICRKNNVIIVCDEIHSDIIRKGEKHLPIIGTLENLCNIVMVSGLCKSFNLMGLHCAYAIIPDDELRRQYTTGYAIPIPTPFAIAAFMAAYDESEDWLDELNEYIDDTLKATIDYMGKKLPKAKVHMPQGTYILWIDFSEYGYDSGYINYLINNVANVGLQPGRSHDPVNGTHYQRMCITSPKAVIFEAIDRIADTFSKYPAE